MTCANTQYNKKGTPDDLLTSNINGARRFKTSSLDSFSGAGASGMAYARTVEITLSAGDFIGAKIEKNSNIAIRFVRASGLYVEAVKGSVNGSIIGLFDLVSTNGVILSDFFGSLDIYDAQPTGDIVIGGADGIGESIYPDGQFVLSIKNQTSETVSTFLTVGVEQLSSAGAYSILEPGTQLEPTTEMSTYNGLN